MACVCATNIGNLRTNFTTSQDGNVKFKFTLKKNLPGLEHWKNERGKACKTDIGSIEWKYWDSSQNELRAIQSTTPISPIKKLFCLIAKCFKKEARIEQSPTLPLEIQKVLEGVLSSFEELDSLQYKIRINAQTETVLILKFHSKDNVSMTLIGRIKKKINSQINSIQTYRNISTF